MKSFSNIMFEVYVEAKNILQLQNITLSFLQSRILTIINKYELNEVTPLQVAGDDTIPGVYDPFGRNAFRNIRTIWYSA